MQVYRRENRNNGSALMRLGAKSSGAVLGIACLKSSMWAKELFPVGRKIPFGWAKLGTVGAIAF